LCYSASEISEEIGVSRQTLWRWRTGGKIPLGHKYRDGKVLFTGDEVDEIRRFANRIEPIAVSTKNQIPLL